MLRAGAIGLLVRTRTMIILLRFGKTKDILIFFVKKRYRERLHRKLRPQTRL